MDGPAYGVRAAVVIEDDDDIRGLLVATLSQAGFTVSSAGTGSEGVDLVRTEQPTVTTLDVSLPDIDGFEVARRVRHFSDTYIVMLTARAEEIDTLMGLDAGADDYLTKPFRPRELRARIEAMMRRPRFLGAPGGAPAEAGAGGGTGGYAGTAAGVPGTAAPGTAGQNPAGTMAPAGPPATGGAPAPAAPFQGAPAPAAPFGGAQAPAAPFGGAPAQAPAAPAVGAPTAATAPPPGIRRHNGLVVDVPGRLVDLDGERVNLTRSEFDLLAALVENPHRVLAKAELARHLWGEDYSSGTPVTDADKRTVEVHVANLRRKLGEDATKPRYVETVRGIGYRLTPSR